MSQRLNEKMKNLTLIEDWYRAATPHNLSNLLSDAMNGNVFASIYVSIRNNPQNETQEGTDTYTYYNVGFSSDDMAKYFNANYSLNYFLYRYDDQTSYGQLRDIISGIYYANKYKYMKLIETMGFRYNPLFNVDGKELYARAESIGDAENEREPQGTVTTTSGQKDGSSFISSESTYYKNPYNNNTVSAVNVDSKTASTPITTEQSYSEDYKETTKLKNIPANNYSYNSESGKWEPNGVFSVAAADNAFGVDFNGAERYYAEKRIRQGNIGVTKSTELLQAQRDLVRFNILDEFFKDLRPHIVVGIF